MVSEGVNEGASETGGMCPCCGYNMTADRPVELDGWRIDPRGYVYYGGELVTNRNSWTQILLALAREEGRFVMSEALLARMTEKDNHNLLASQVACLKKHISSMGLPDPIASRRKPGGYLWRT